MVRDTRGNAFHGLRKNTKLRRNLGIWYKRSPGEPGTWWENSKLEKYPKNTGHRLWASEIWNQVRIKYGRNFESSSNQDHFKVSQEKKYMS